MFKKKILRNIPLLFLLIIYTIIHIIFYSNDFYTNFLNPLFWLIFLIIFHHQDLELLNRKDSNITLMVAIILFILYLASGFVFGFSKSPYSHNLSNILLNSMKIILNIYGIEVIRHTLLKSNKCHFGIRVLITLIIILSEINFKALFLSRNIALLHYLISIIIPIIAYNFLYSYLSLNSHYNIPIILRLFNELPKVLLPILPYHNWFIEGAFSTIKVLII